MLKQVLHKTIAMLVTASVAWHSVAGCCWHHVHSPMGKSSANKGDEQIQNRLHSNSCCHCERISIQPDPTQTDSCICATASDDGSQRSTCDETKCSFATGGPPPRVPCGDALSLDTVCVSHATYCATARQETDDWETWSPCGSLGARGARPQQLLCVWRI